MSQIALSPNPAGNGTFTIEAPNSNNNRTLTLPDNTGTVLTSASDLAAANLTGNVAAARITDALNAGGSAPIYACRAWVNFNGTGTVAIRASGNVSSITDNGTGLYTVNFTTAMPDLNYATVGQAWFAGVSGALLGIVGTPTSTTSKQINVTNPGATAGLDADHITVAIFR